MAQESPAAAHLVYETPVARLAREGLQLNKSLDDLSMQEVSRLSNLVHAGGDLFTRLGQTNLATMSGTVHSVRRLNNPLGANFTRFWGAGASWFRGASGALGALAGGFSGNPLSLLTIRPPFSGEPWMVAADSTLMQKASSTSPSLPLGLPVPTGLVTAASSALTTPVAAFDNSDGTNASNWTTFRGIPPLELGTIESGLSYTTAVAAVDVAGVGGNGVDLILATTNLPPGAVGFLAGMALAKAMDLSQLPGAVAATDDDALHLNLRVNFPSIVEEIRIYFVCSPFVMPGPTAQGAPTWSLPGMGVGNFSPSAYLLTLRPSDYTTALQATETMQSGADRVRTSAFLETFADPVAAAQAQTPSNETTASAGVWTTFSAVVPPTAILPGFQFPVLRRGDLTKIGTAGERGTDWSTITGIYIAVLMPPQTGQFSFPGQQPLQVAFDNLYLTGGSGPDTSEPGALTYDYRVTNYDPRTGARSNGSPIQTGAPGALDVHGVILPGDKNVPDLTLDVLRQPITITPAAYPGDGAIRQEAYRRGGVLNDNWYFVAANTTNGGVISDTFADADLTNVATVPLDHFQPVATVDASGNTILAQPLPILFGPFDDGTVCGLGDPHQPGFLYACLPGEIDHWPSTGGYAVEVCAPSEELMNGCVHGGQGFVLSRERGYTVYTNISGGEGITVVPSGCTPGLAARWGFCQGPGGIFYVSRESVRVTQGGASQILSDQIRPLFHGGTVNGRAAIDFSVPAAIRLAVFDTDLYFLYQDINGVRQCFVYSLVYQYWRPYDFAKPVAVAYQDETVSERDAMGDLQLILGSTNGQGYTYSGFTDDGTPISFALRTGAWNWSRPREEKLLGDLVLEATLAGTTVTLTPYLNTEAIVGAVFTVTGGATRTRYIIEPFGTTPQHARSVSYDLTGTAPLTGQASFSFLGQGYVIQPEVTMNRATTWEPLGETEGYVYACVIDCDTGGSPRTILVEYDLAGGIATAATLTVNANGRHKLWFSWPAVHAQLVRLRPQGSCAPWMLFNVEWISQPEPPRIAGWDTNFEDLGDSYYTGLDLELDTFGQNKTLVVTVDGVPIAGSPFTVNASGHSHRHLTFTPGRGHVYRFVSTDANPGLLYTHQWITDPEPLEQTNWNAPYTVYNSLSDKYLKGIILEADTFGQDKSVAVQADGGTLTIIQPVNHNGRSVQNYTFPQVLGRVFRLIPTDANPSRLYTAQPIFDEEPFALARWETQLLDFDLPGSGWGSVLSADLCYRASAPVTFTIAVYNAQGSLLQTVTGQDQQSGAAVLPSTSNTKQKRYVTFPANKGVLFKTILTTADGSGVTVYKEESRLRVNPWSGQMALLKPLGNDDLDATREMTKAAVAAGRNSGAAR